MKILFFSKNSTPAIPLILLSATLASCASNPTTNTQSKAEPPNRVNIQKSNIAIKQGNASIRKTKGYYAKYQTNNQVPTLIEISAEPPAITDHKKSEVIFFSNDLTFAQPDFRTFKFDDKSSSFICFKGALRTDRDNATNDYNPCDSSLTSVSSYNLGSQAFLAVASFGLSAVTGTTIINVTTDEEKLISLITKTNSLELIAKRRKNDEYEKYLKDYSAAASIQLLNEFIRIHASNDPNQLIPAARDKIAQLTIEQNKKQELNARQQQVRQEEEKARREKELAEQAVRQQEVNRRRLAREAEVAQYRKGLKIGDRTNCGPIIEMKINLLKIYFPVSNYGNEHWIDRSTVFPSNYSCHFMNGRYVPPSV